MRCVTGSSTRGLARVSFPADVRVLVCSQAGSLLTAAQVGTAIAQGWIRGDTSAQCAVLGLGVGGEPLADAVSDLEDRPVRSLDLDTDELIWGVDADTLGFVTVEPLPRDLISVEDRMGITSAAWGRALAALGPRPEAVIDLSGYRGLDGGWGMLTALAGREDDPATMVQLARRRLGDGRLVGLIPDTETRQLLTGLRGITSLAAQSEREQGGEPDPAVLLAHDRHLETWVDDLLDGEPPEYDSGACGGLGLVIRALGGDVLTGPAWLAERAGLEETLRRCDLIVTTAVSYDFASRGGGVVQQVATWASDHLRPCIVLAESVVIGGREQRTMGIEAAYAASERGDERAVNETQWEALARRVSHTWRW